MDEPSVTAPSWLDLYDWRRRVAAMYVEREQAHRRGEDGAATAARFRAQKDALFRAHPQSPLDPDDRARFAGLGYFAYDPALAVVATLALEPAEAGDAELPASGQHAMRFARAGRVSFSVANQPLHLIVYWIDVYGGGLFLPFRDATCRGPSYGGGRYLFDTVKGSDFVRLDAQTAGTMAPGAMGYGGGRMLLDFNYAYNPSCAYSPRWVCPLAPNENQLPVAITAGEQAFHP